MASSNEGFQRGFLLSDKSQKVVDNKKKTKTKSSSGFQSGFLLRGSKPKATATESLGNQNNKNNKDDKVTTIRTSKSKRSTGGFSKGFLLSKKENYVSKKTEKSVKQEDNGPKEATTEYVSSKEKKKVLLSQQLLAFDDPPEWALTESLDSKEKKTKVIVSQDLLEFDDPPKPRKEANPLFIVEDDRDNEVGASNEATSKPLLISFVNVDGTVNENDNRKSSLISVVDDERSSSLTHLDDGTRGKILHKVARGDEPLTLENEPEPLWKEVTTTRRARQDIVLEPSTDTRSREELPTIRQPLENDSTTAPFEVPQKQPFLDTSNDNSSFFKFQQELESLGWQNQNENQASAVIKDWNATQVSWAWQWAFDGKKRKKDTLRQPLFVRSLLQYHPTSIVKVLQPQNSADRMVSLQAVHFLQDYLSNQQQGQEQTQGDAIDVEEWSTVILPELLKLAEQPRRTVLAQDSWTVSIWMIVTMCETCLFKKNPSSDEECLSSISPMTGQLERLLQVQLSWKRPKKSSAKSQAMISILEDWRRGNRAFQRVLPTTGWCEQVIGLQSQNSTFLGWGGLRQTLCGGDGSSGTPITTVEQALSSCWQKNDSTTDDPCEFEKRSLLRGALAIVVTTKLKSHQQQQLVDISFRLLSRCTRSETIDLILSLLNYLWSATGGLPPDIVPSNAEQSKQSFVMPKSVETLLDTIESSTQEQSQTNKLDPTCQAMSKLLARCIVAHAKSLDLIKAVVSRHGMKDTTVHTLLNVVTGIDSFQSGSSSPTVKERSNDGAQDFAENEEKSVLSYVADVLIGAISSSVYLRQHLCKECVLESHGIPIGSTVPKLIRILFEHADEKTKDSADISSSTAMVLTSIMERQVLLGRIDSLIHQAVTALEATTKEKAVVSKELVGQVCSAFCGRWRRSLLSNVTFGKDAFGDVLISIGKAMFLSPSSMVSLTLFGGLVGGDVDEEDITTDIARSRVHVAIENIIEICCQSLKQSDNFQGPDAIFSRLSPLLMLRRVPVVYFQVARRESRIWSVQSHVYDSSCVLAEELATRLGIHTVSGHRMDFSDEERRLAAEVAGRCLSFGELEDVAATQTASKSCSTFLLICKPAFTLFLRAVTKMSTKSAMIGAIRTARAALYATCNHLPFANDDERYDNDIYRQTASFALETLCVDAHCVPPEVSSDLVKLQTGSIEFFAMCIEKTLQNQKYHEAPKNQLVEEVAGRIAETSMKHMKSRGLSASSSLQQICRSVVTILRVGKSSDAWVDSAKPFFLGHALQARGDFSVPARICLWNALIVVAQRCRDDDQSLNRFSRSTLPWVAEWGAGARPNDDIHHPLCVAAALQLIFVSVTRSKSLDCFAGRDGPPKKYIQQVHRWALEAAKAEPNSFENYANRALRLAALKLMLAIVTIDNINSDGSALPSSMGPGELGETFTVVYGVSNMDPDSEVRELASHILGMLRGG